MNMRQENFRETMIATLPALHKFFYHHLKGMRIPGNIDQHVDDLIQLTSLQAYLNSQKESLASYPLQTLLRLKARNELANFFQLVKKHAHFVALDQDYETASPDPDPYERLVQREEMTRLQTLIDQEALDLFYQLADTTYRKMAGQRQTTEAALKMKIYRLRKQFLQRARPC